MKKAWSHLPNAVHIDRILKDVKVNRERWLAASTYAEKVINEEVRIAVMDEYCRTVWDNNLVSRSVWKAILDSPGRRFRFSSWAPAWDAAWDAIVSLAVCERSADYLDMTPENLICRVMFNDNKAVLMLPAVMAFEKSKELA